MLFAACVSLSVLSDARAVADEASQNPSRRTASGWAKKDKTSVDLDTAIKEKLQKILTNQQLILQRADAVKQELEVIKVRVSTPVRSVTFLSTGQACP